MFIVLFVVKYYSICDLFFCDYVTVTFYGRANDRAEVRVDGVHVTNIRDPDVTTEFILPNDTRLLALYAYDLSGNEQPGIQVKLSNGFFTGSHWRCTHSDPDDWWRLTYNDTAWPQAVIYSWPRGVHHLRPAEFISGERYGSYGLVWCRGWVSKYSKHGY